MKSKSFEELATPTHDMELSMAIAANQEPSKQEIHNMGKILVDDEDVD